MKQRRPAPPSPPRVLNPGELTQVSAGAATAVVEKLKQHVDNPGQTA
jgi:hypothetical protein